MEKVGILMLLNAKEGKERETARFLRSTRVMADEEREIKSYYVFRLGPTGFGIYSTFTGEEAKRAQRCGKIVKAFFANSAELFSPLPTGEDIEILTAKVPDSRSLGLSRSQEAGLGKSLLRGIH